jgi:hypothetical protein
VPGAELTGTSPMRAAGRPVRDRRRAVAARLAGLGVLLVLVATASGRDRTSHLSHRPDVPGHAVTVDVVGDSLVTQAAAELTEQLAGAGLDATVAHRPRQDLGSDFVQGQLAGVRARRPADVLVVATAANDALRDLDRTLAAGPEVAAVAYTELLDRSLEPFADRCVVVVNAREDTADIYHPEHARIVNALLRDAHDRHRNLVVVDWAAISRAVPGELFASDQLHFGTDPTVASVGSGSARAYAAAIVHGIRDCR